MRRFAIAVTLLLALPAPLPAQPASPPAPGQARMYFYRVPAAGASTSWTEVYLNGEQVGDSGPGTYFWRDVPPGRYEITLRSQGLSPGQFQTATVGAGETVYVRVSSLNYFGLGGGGINFAGGGRFMSSGPLSSTPTFADQIIDPVQARQEMANLQPAS